MKFESGNILISSANGTGTHAAAYSLAPTNTICIPVDQFDGREKLSEILHRVEGLLLDDKTTGIILESSASLLLKMQSEVIRLLKLNTNLNRLLIFVVESKCEDKIAALAPHFSCRLLGRCGEPFEESEKRKELNMGDFIIPGKGKLSISFETLQSPQPNRI